MLVAGVQIQDGQKECALAVDGRNHACPLDVTIAVSFSATDVFFCFLFSPLPWLIHTCGVAVSYWMFHAYARVAPVIRSKDIAIETGVLQNEEKIGKLSYED